MNAESLRSYAYSSKTLAFLSNPPYPSTRPSALADGKVHIEMQTSLAQGLSTYVKKRGGLDGLHLTSMDGLVIFKASGGDLPYHAVYRPSLCIVAQGAKRVTFEDHVLDYEVGEALVVSVEVPAVGEITRATAQDPYLALALEFDFAIMCQVMDELEHPPKPNCRVGLGAFVSSTGGPLLECAIRLVHLLEMPDALRILYPAIMREICYWLLTGPHAGDICKIVIGDSHTQRIAEAINVLRDGYSRTIRTEELASAACMGVSSFHQHFKALTSMTPLQYQKNLRLLEARRILAADGTDVASAAFQVGYESASQFSREYTRMFGIAPKRDALRGRIAAA